MDHFFGSDWLENGEALVPRRFGFSRVQRTAFTGLRGRRPGDHSPPAPAVERAHRWSGYSMPQRPCPHWGNPQPPPGGGVLHIGSWLDPAE